MLSLVYEPKKNLSTKNSGEEEARLSSQEPSGKGPLPVVRPQDEVEAGLPAYRTNFRPSHQSGSGTLRKVAYSIYGGGSAPDLHGIPY